MKCKTLHNKLIFYLEGDLPGKEAEQVRHHLSECPDCSAFAEEMKKTFRVLETEKSPEVNPFFFTRIKAKMESEAELSPANKRNPVLAHVIQPALFSLLLLTGIFAGIKIGENVQNQMVASSEKEQVIPYLNEMEAEPIESFLMD
jgi:anti-sigma factor RsiW